MYPDRKTAEYELGIAGEFNRGPWPEHSKKPSSIPPAATEYIRSRPTGGTKLSGKKKEFGDKAGKFVYTILPDTEKSIYL